MIVAHVDPRHLEQLHDLAGVNPLLAYQIPVGSERPRAGGSP